MEKASSPFLATPFLATPLPDRLALLLSLLAVIASYLVSDRVFERLPHIEDEAAYLWQARVFAGGKLTLPTLEHSKSFLVPFVVSYEGQRFSKYTPGWSLVLALGVKLGVPFWVNPLLAGLGVWLTYLVGRRYFSMPVGLLAAALTVPSPVFLMNSGSQLSHPLGLVLTAGLALAWFGVARNGVARNDAFFPQKSGINKQDSSILSLLAGLCLGMLILTRPFTAAAVAVPFGLHGLYLLIRGDWPTRRGVLLVGGITLAFTLLYLGWTWAMTGDPLMNTYTLWWPYDKIGFAKGVGVLERGHNLHQAIENTQQSLNSGLFTLFGWGPLSWLFLPVGLWALFKATGQKIRHAPAIRMPVLPAWMLMTVFPILVVFYMAYWIGSNLYGPRYYYEGLLSLTLLSGAGIAYLAGWRVFDRYSDLTPETQRSSVPSPDITPCPSPTGEGRPQSKHIQWRHSWRRHSWRGVLVSMLVTSLVAYNLAVYLPDRLRSMHGLYGSNRQILVNFQSARVTGGSQSLGESPRGEPVQPALVIVHSEKWQFYGALMELQDPFLTTPIIFAWSMLPSTNAELQDDFPDRTVYHYYETDPSVLYPEPKELESP